MLKNRLLFLPLFLPLFLILVILPFLILFFIVFTGFTVGNLLGISPENTILIFLLIAIGSFVNIPVVEVKTRETDYHPFSIFGWLYRVPRVRKTVIAVNLGGCVIPSVLSIYFLSSMPLQMWLPSISLISLITYFNAKPVKHVGIAIPMLLPPAVSVFVSYLIIQALSLSMFFLPRLAFSAGVLGVLIGADILHLKDVTRIGPAVVSIGGAGTFDGIFLTGIFAVLLSAFFLPI